MRSTLRERMGGIVLRSSRTEVMSDEEEEEGEGLARLEEEREDCLRLEEDGVGMGGRG